ncbi:MAG: anthranilate synthase component I family protein [Tenuifilum sp.]|uniref:anthranilate synthase component I family protein n=1 Tax=Tenuifilum sp. TaxID=2760880 RepID=UPI0030ACB5A5
MKITRITVKSRRISADTYTPIGVYLKLRDAYPQCLLLECADYSERSDAFSYICVKPFAGIEVTGAKTKTYMLLESSEFNTLDEYPPALFDSFLQSFKIDNTDVGNAGFFGFTAYDSINLFDNVNIETSNAVFPLIKYDFYQVVIEFNHFNNTLTLYEFLAPNVDEISSKLLSLLSNKNTPTFPFQATSEEYSNMNDDYYMEMVEKGKLHCARGDVFQIVLSRQFSKKYSGDDFNVYRALRSINPSPYLFYFDYMNFRIFGSSPEAHLKVTNGVATINPIAGTTARSGDAQLDKKITDELLKNPKENSEHCMLVDLARNDLSRYAVEVTVDKFREVQSYSHVIHLVSCVKGKLKPNTKPYSLLASTFPAGTLSGAPKHKAIQLIGNIEPTPRGIYGGAVGFIGINGDINHAIVIRSFISSKGTLYYQAGAGVVIGSSPKGELAEVNSKISALRRAIEYAEKIV